MSDIRERIVIEIDDSGAIAGARRVAGALGGITSETRNVSSGIESATRRLVAFGAGWLSLQGARQLAAIADGVQGVNSRLLIGTGSIEAFTAAQRRAYEISAQTGSGYEATATLLTRLSQVGTGYGLTQERIATTTEVTAKALQLSGAAAAESSAVIRQLSQALGSGVLRGEEFNSVMENGPRLARALADGLGLPIGKLRGLAEQGLLTTDVVVKALESQRATLEAESANYQRTMGQAAGHVSDAFGSMVDAANQWTGAGQGVAATMDYVADHMQAALGVVAVGAVAGLTVAITKGGQAAVASAAQYIAAQGQQVASTIRLQQSVVAMARAEVIAAEQRLASVPAMFRTVAMEQALTTARTNLTTATAALTRVQAESTIAARGLSAVVSGLGGPIGIITTLLTFGATAWAIWGRAAEDAGDKAESAAERGRAAMDRLRNAKSFGQDELAPMRENVSAAQAALDEAKRKQAEADAALKKAQETARTGGRAAQSSAMPFVAKGAVEAAEKNLAQAKADLKEAEEIVKALPGRSGASGGLDLMGQSFDKWVGKFQDKIDPLGSALKELGEQAKAAGIAVDSQKYRAAEALVRKSFEKKGTAASAGKALDLDNYGKSALSQVQAQSQRELDLIKTKLTAEQDASTRAYESGKASLEQYFADRSRISQAGYAAEIAAQERIAAQAESEKARLSQIKPSGTRGSEQIEDQTRALDEKIADARAKIEQLRIQASGASAGISAEQAKAARERITQAMSDAQAIISAKEQSLESRVVTGLESEASARAKLKAAISEQGEALEKDLVPQIERMMQAANDPRAVAEMQAMLDKIREMNAEAKTQTWQDGLKKGVDDYATSASDAFDSAKNAATSAFSGMEDALVQFTTTGKLTVGDMVNSMIADFARLAIRQNITKPLATGFSGVIGSLFGGGSSWSGAATTDASIFGNSGFGLANGGVVRGGVHRWANSVVSTPTAFDASGLQPFAQGGVFGEAGPEAVMPLTRMGNGKLGVAASGSSGSGVSVEINNYSGQQVKQREVQDARGGRKIQVTIGDMVAGEMARPGSAVNKSVRNGFGLRPALVGR